MCKAFGQKGNSGTGLLFVKGKSAGNEKGKNPGGNGAPWVMEVKKG